MVFTFGNPVNIRLTDEGAALALKLHRAAEARGDCRCGLVPPATESESQGTAAPASGGGGYGGGAARGVHRSPASQPVPPRAPPARAPPPLVDDDDDCIIISDDDVAAPAPPPAKRPATQQQRALTPPRQAGGGGGEFSAKPLPQWRLSALNSDADHGTRMLSAPASFSHALHPSVTDPRVCAGVRLPPLPAGVPFGQEYDVVLLIDNREQFAHGVSGGRTEGAQEGLARLRQRGVVAELRTLCIGDALWLARSRRNPASEYCLDFVVERKRIDDLESSIKDARYKQQKYFLKRCGLRHPVYLLEGEPGALGAISGVGAEWRTKAVKTAMLTTEVVDGFQVLRTTDAHGTFDAYGQLTDALRALYATLSGPASAAAAPTAVCPMFAAFAATVAAVRREAKTARALWGLMLTQVPGVGGDVAEAVLWEYATPSALRDAYAATAGRDARRAMLAPLRTSAVKTVGPVLSARIYDWCTQAGGEALL
jgi:crossover junction endonuclease MUS81